MTLDDILGPCAVTEDSTKPVMLIDSDTICYRAAAATDGRQYLVGNVAIKYKEDAVKYCKKHDINVSEIQIEYYPEPVSHAIHIVKGAINGIKAASRDRFGYVADMEFFHSGKKNFRYDIIDDYKGNREDLRRPENLSDCKDYVRKHYVEKQDPNLEADDLIGVRAYELREQGRDYVIVTNDKDLKTIPGENLDWVTGTWCEVSEVDAVKFLYAQAIAGDPTDNIPGVSGMAINKKGTGRAQTYIEKVFVNEMETNGDLPASELEVILYNASLEAWLSGGPGKKGSYGCNSLKEIEEMFKRTAQCVFILHKRDRLWQPPINGWRNYERLFNG